MQALRRYVEKTETCLALADRLAENPLVQGVHVEPRPDLLLSWIERRFGGGLVTDRPYGLGGLPLDVPTDPEFDFDGSHGSDGDPLPLRVRVHLCPARAGEAAEERRLDAWKAVEEFRSRVEVVFEDRARTVAAISPGDGLAESLPGTLGGFLADGVDLFGVTCAHVAKAGRTVRDASGATVGIVQAASPLSPSPPGVLCRPGAQIANRMDAAVFDHQPAAPLPSGLAASRTYGSGQRALMRGATSGGPNPYYFGSLGLTHIVDIPGPIPGSARPHCFHLLSSIRPVPGFWGWAGWPAQRARRGDSGAFITDVGGTLWFGMLCAVDGTEGFLLDATEVLRWARNDLGRPGLMPY
jgi:hypothetical protein